MSWTTDGIVIVDKKMIKNLYLANLNITFVIVNDCHLDIQNVFSKLFSSLNVLSYVQCAEFFHIECASLCAKQMR